VGGVKFRILGPLEVSRNDAPVTISGRHHPKLLALLLLETGRIVTVSRLVDALWENDPPTTARRQVQNTMASLRRQLAGDDAPDIEATGEGYRLLAHATTVDAQCFTDLVRQAREARDHDDLTTAARLFGEALTLWRGEALAGLSGRVVEAAVVRLNESRLTAIEDRCEIDITLGRHGQVVGELRELLEHHPYRQRIAGLLMTALHHSGRTPEALEVFTEVRARLSDELGLDPDPDLTRLHSEILRGDLDTPAPDRTQPSPPRPAQLPADTATFTGRTEQLSALNNLLAEGRTATVVSAIAGMGGAGKTALAVHWAHRVRERFPDGQLYVNLRGYDENAPVSPVDALARFLHALGQPGSAIPDDPDEAGAMYRSLLADQRMLIILDNARDAAQVRPLLPGGSGNFALITSRDRLTSLVALDDVAPLRIDTLSHDESVELLANIVGADRLHSAPESAHRLAKLCGYLPLALRIAGANLAERTTISVTAFAAELEGPQRLERLAVADDPAAAVARTLDLSVGTLSAEGQGLLAALGIHPGEDFTEDLAIAVADAIGFDGVRTLAELETAHLLERQSGDRLRFHDLVREFAHNRAHATFDSDLRARIRSRTIAWYYQHQQTLSLHEYSNVVSAFDAWESERESWKLAVALWSFSNSAHDTDKILQLVERGLHGAEASGDIEGRCRMYLTLGTYHRERGNHEAAVSFARRAVAAAQESPQGDADGRYRGNLGIFLAELGRFSEGADWLRQAMHAAESVGNKRYQIASTSSLADDCRLLGRYEEAEQLFLKVREMQAETEQPGFSTQFMMAQLYRDMGRVEDATRVLDQLFTQLVEERDTRILIFAHLLRAELHRINQRYEAAGTELSTAHELVTKTGRDGLRVDVELAWAEWYVERGRFTQATAHVDAIDQSETDEPSLMVAADVLRIRTSILIGQHFFDEAVRLGTEALELYSTMSSPLARARTLLTLAEAHTRTGDEQSAMALRRQASAVFAKLGIPETDQLRPRLTPATVADGPHPHGK
jgi:DNA-binding SARP family transcriptional activator/Tfp pilus assembly protein PilF